MSNSSGYHATASIFTVSSNVTMGPVRPSFVNSEKISITEQKRLFPKYAGVGVVLSTLCNPVLGVLAVFAYLRARHAHAHGRYETAVSYMTVVFVLGIIGMSITLMTAAVVYVYSNEEYVLVEEEVKSGKTNKTEIPKYLGYLQGKNMLRKTQEQKRKEEAFPFNTSSPEQVRVVEVVFETDNASTESHERNAIGKMDMERVLYTVMGKDMEEINRETINTIRDVNSAVVEEQYVVVTGGDGTGGRSARDTEKAKTKFNSSRRRKGRSNACHQLQLLLKGNSIKVRMKMKYPLLGWKPAVVEITDHTDCIVVV